MGSVSGTNRLRRVHAFVGHRLLSLPRRPPHRLVAVLFASSDCRVQETRIRLTFRSGLQISGIAEAPLSTKPESSSRSGWVCVGTVYTEQVTQPWADAPTLDPHYNACVRVCTMGSVEATLLSQPSDHVFHAASPVSCLGGGELSGTEHRHCPTRERPVVTSDNGERGSQ